MRQCWPSRLLFAVFFIRFFEKKAFWDFFAKIKIGLPTNNFGRLVFICCKYSRKHYKTEHVTNKNCANRVNWPAKKNMLAVSLYQISKLYHIFPALGLGWANIVAPFLLAHFGSFFFFGQHWRIPTWSSIFVFTVKPKMPVTQKFLDFVTVTFNLSRAFFRKLSPARPKFSRAFFPKFSRASWKIHGHFEK